MNLIEETVRKEKSRIEFMLCEYEERKKQLPKGTISEWHSGSKTYYYLKYRDGKRVVSQYLTIEEKNKLNMLISERKHIDMMIKSLKDELSFANHALGEKK